VELEQSIAETKAAYKEELVRSGRSSRGSAGRCAITPSASGTIAEKTTFFFWRGALRSTSSSPPSSVLLLLATGLAYLLNQSPTVSAPR
jgi:hypothetical protein